MIGKLLCRFLGHKRGRRANGVPMTAGTQMYRCPRCHATWTRKVKNAVS